MLLTIDSHEPQPWLVARAANTLRAGGIAVVPTDTVYALACALDNRDAVERLYAVKGITPSKRLSILVHDLSTASRYARGMTTPTFRMMKRVLPGPYTFIFQATGDVPKVMLRKRRTVGIRYPDSPITLAILSELGQPLLTTSVRSDNDAFVVDPVAIEDELGPQVDMVVDGGLLETVPSTVVDLSDDEPILVREGKGDVAALELFT